MTSETSEIKDAVFSLLRSGGLERTSKTPASLDEIRKDALQTLSNLDFPTNKHEEWKYTDITKALKKNFDFNRYSTAPAYTREQLDPFKYPGMDANYLVFINGKFSGELSDYSSLGQSILIENLTVAFDQNHSLIREHFAKHAEFQKDFFNALSTAFTEDGVFIRIFDGAIIERPIVFLMISDSTNGNTVAQPRNLICVGKNCKAILIENYISVGDNPQFTNAVSELVLDENSFVDYYKLQNEKENTYHVGTTQVYQSRNSNFSSTTVTTNGGVIRNNLNIKLDGEGAEATMYGLYLLNGKTHVDNHTAVDHAQPKALSNELYKGVMNGKSTGVFNGKIYVRKDAQKTNAFQSNRNVLLSDDASINTKPQLEIWADDVKCSHGATTGQIDEEALFYLQSRGISKDKAKALLMTAFASEIIKVIKVKEVKESLEKLIDELLHK